MRLFHQLNDEDRDNAINYCVNTVIQDVIDGDVHLEPEDQEEIALQAMINEAHEHCKTLEEFGDKAEYIMSNKELSGAVVDMAIEMCKSAFYCDDEEMVIYPSSLKHECCEHCDHDNEGEELPPIEDETVAKKKPNHSLN